MGANGAVNDTELAFQLTSGYVPISFFNSFTRLSSSMSKVVVGMFPEFEILRML
jgi:hypothetical protein